MFERILVPLDGSPESASALPAARVLAEATAASLTLLRVVHAASGDAHAAEERESREYLEGVAQELRAAPLNVATVIRTGSPASEIVQESQAGQHDLIAMATHGRGGLRRALLGSVTDGVLAHSAVPVLALRPGGHRLTQVRTLLVPVETSSPGSALALGAAVGLARKTGAKIVLLQVAVPLPLWIYEPTIGLNTGPFIDPMWNEDAQAAAQEHVDALAARLREQGIDAEGQSAVGGAADVIVKVARELPADLLVMSTQGYTGAARVVMGSVADAVVRAAEQPVLLIRRGAHLSEEPVPAAAAEEVR